MIVVPVPLWLAICGALLVWVLEGTGSTTASRFVRELVVTVCCVVVALALYLTVAQW